MGGTSPTRLAFISLLLDCSRGTLGRYRGLRAIAVAGLSRGLQGLGWPRRTSTHPSEPTHGSANQNAQHPLAGSHAAFLVTDLIDVRERAALCDLLLELGPDAPTLCEGWTTA